MFSAAPPLIDRALLPEVAVEHTVSPHCFQIDGRPIADCDPGVGAAAELPRTSAAGARRRHGLRGHGEVA